MTDPVEKIEPIVLYMQTFRQILIQELNLYEMMVKMEADIPDNPQVEKKKPDMIERIMNLLWSADVYKFQFDKQIDILAPQVFTNPDIRDFLFSLSAQLRVYLGYEDHNTFIVDHVAALCCHWPAVIKSSKEVHEVARGPIPFIDAMLLRPNAETSQSIFLANDWLSMLVLIRVHMGDLVEFIGKKIETATAANKAESKRQAAAQAAAPRSPTGGNSMLA